MKRIAVFGFALSVVVSAVILVFLPRMRTDGGGSRVIVMRRELLELLAADQQCIENLPEINFSSVEFRALDEELLSKMANSSTINFYCCKNADSILPACSKLPLISVGFELTNFSPESVQLLGSVPTLASFHVEQNLDKFQVAAMKLLPITVTIRSSFPMDAYD